MHGIIYSHLFKYVRENHGFDKLTQIREHAAIKTTFYDATKSHPDEDIVALITAASEIFEIEVEAILEDFGFYIAPKLLNTYSSLLNAEWNCFDLIENVEHTMHRTVRGSLDEATPPVLKIKRVNDSEVHIDYLSQRNMIALGIGIIKAIGEYFKENLQISKESLQPSGTRLLIKRAV